MISDPQKDASAIGAATLSPHGANAPNSGPATTATPEAQRETPRETHAPREMQKSGRSPAAVRHARERIVLICMGLVTAATAAALYVVYEFALGSAVLGASGVWAALMTIHLQLKKDGEIKRLKAELNRMERGVATRTAAATGPHSANPMMAPMPAPTAGQVAGQVAGQPSGMVMPSRPVSSTSVSSTPASSTPVAVEPAAMEYDGEASAPVSAPEAAPETTSLRLDPNPRWTTSQTPQRAAKPVAAEPSRSATRQPAPQPPAESAFWPGTEVSASDPMRDQWAFRPREDKDANPPSPAAHAKPISIEADLEMVQRKIKALADEVNAADAARERQRAAKDAAAVPDAAPDEAPARASMIEQSIGALKSAASSMRSKSPANKSPAKPDGDAVKAAPPSTAASLGPLSLDDLIPKTAQTIVASDPDRSLPPLPDLPPMPTLSQPPEPPVNPRIAAIAEALQDSEMDVFLSPIVALQSHEVSHYDVTVRLKSRSGHYLDDAEQELRLAGSDLLALFDTARLKRAAALARKLEAHKKKGSLLSAVNGPSMSNTEFLETFARVFEERDRISNQLVLTFTQADIEQLTPSAWQSLGDMHAFGFRFALSNVDHAGMDFAALTQRGFAFLRLDANALLNGLPARDHFMGPDELCRHLAGAGMTLVADTIDDEAVRARIFGFGILFGQGRLFGGARQIKLDPIPSSSPAAA